MSRPRIDWLSHLAWAEGEHLTVEGDGACWLRLRDGRAPLGPIARLAPEDIPPEARAELEELRAAWLDAPAREDLHTEWEHVYRRGLI